MKNKQTTTPQTNTPKNLINISVTVYTHQPVIHVSFGQTICILEKILILFRKYKMHFSIPFYWMKCNS